MPRLALLLSTISVLLSACSSEGTTPNPCASAGLSAMSRFPAGSPEGHADPVGARAAGQARAGRITDPAWIKQAPDVPHRAQVGDFLLANDKIAVYIEAARPSDGYLPFGGEVLGIDPVGPDGLPIGVSEYGETLILLARQAVAPDSVTVLADGSDGGAAIVRSSGVLKGVPFLDTYEWLFREAFDFPAALDYVLEPGSERVVVRLSLMNLRAARVDFSSLQIAGFFQSSRSQVFTEEQGFANPADASPWVGWDGRGSAFAWRMPGAPLSYLIGVAGFTAFRAQGLALESCQTKTTDYGELITGAPGIDGLRQAIRRVDGLPPWRELSGVVQETGGQPVGGAEVHAQTPGGLYLTRAQAAADGSFSLHLPPEDVTLVATHPSYELSAPVPVAAGAIAATVLLPGTGTLELHVRDADSLASLPVRIQVIPATPPTEAPASFAFDREVGGRLIQEYAVTGTTRLALPPGMHRVIVSRGFEWELDDRMVQIDAGQTTVVNVDLRRGVDSTGVMCADFHIHSFYSMDSSDPVLSKVKAALADGVEIPVSSEHEYIVDFQPVIQQLGLQDWAYGFPSEEFTTFTWGHFGIVPMNPRPGLRNRGAMEWYGRGAGEVFQEIHQLPWQPLLIVNHPRMEAPLGYFTVTGFDRGTASSSDPLWSDLFDVLEVFNDSDFESNRDSTVADWFALLQAGRTVWAVGSSDSHKLRSSPVGYPRTCLRFGHDDPRQLSAERVRDALAAGAATVSGGLYLTVEGPGGIGPGETVPAQAGPIEMKVVVQAPSWIQAQTLEVIINGKTTQTIQLQESVSAGPARRYEALVPVSAAPGQRNWVVFHASSPKDELVPLHPGRRPFAASNPIFF